MAQPSRKLILFLGAPSAASLLSSNERVLSYPTPPFEPVPEPNAARLEDYLGTGSFPTLSTFRPTGTQDDADKESHGAVRGIPISSSRLKPISIPAWRILPLQAPSLHTGYTQRPYDPTPSIYAWKQHCEASFVPHGTTIPDETQASNIAGPLPKEYASSPQIPLSPTVPRLSFNEEDFEDSYTTELNSSFILERSYAVHNLPSSQVPPVSTSPPPSSSSPPNPPILKSTAYEAEISVYEEDTLPPPLPPIPVTKITELEDLPSPSMLLNPYKTYMATLLVGIMKVESQIIKTKYQNEANPSGKVELLTFTVGDYTLAGLQVKIWLSLQQEERGRVENPSLIPGLEKCRYLTRGDIVMFQDLVLSTFKGVVYANSLRRERSKVVFVYREKKGFRADLSDPVDGAVEKVRRVREWVRGYVGCEEEDGRDDEIPLESF
ncbi:hypothetical protein ABW20_dc0100688 [Dactylellina cionopaga]|nr:hypothetical protein ABW20_dc0100688 [Dactylellina cionopaga]